MMQDFMKRVGWLVTILAVLISGCRERGVAYRTPAEPISQNQKILVLPFMDARTFVDSRDPHREDMGEYAREIFVAAMRENANSGNAVIVSPVLPPQKTSLTTAQAAELGRQYGADMVVAGQVFSFTGTRAVSIPPRAGMFVRVVSARDGSLLFVGDDYQAASFPGAPGGRDLQARNVSNHLVEGMFAQTGPVVAKLNGKTASTSALASLPLFRSSLTANNTTRNSANDNDNNDAKDSLPPLPLLVGLDAKNAIDPVEWDKQIAPAVPPIIDFNDDLYKLTPPAPQGGLVAKPFAGSANDVNAPAKEDGAPATAAEVAAVPAKTEQPQAAPVAVVASANDAPATDETASASFGEMPLPLPPPADIESEEKSETLASAETASPETASAKADETVAAASEETPIPHPSVDRFYASVEAEITDASYAAGLSGDELAADIFAETFAAVQSKGSAVDAVSPAAEVLAEPAVAAKSVGAGEGVETAAAGASTEAAAATVVAEAAGSAEKADAARENGESAQLAEATATRTDGVENGGTENAGRTITVTLDDASRDELLELAMGLPSKRFEQGPVISVPLAIEQPRPMLAIEGEEQAGNAPIAMSFDSEAALAASTDAPLRVLVLPYHDRDNSNNLIPRTGGGEVVTTLYGARLALERDVQVLWDASGQLSHGRLIDKTEALQLGQMVGADFVMRGQVVEFRRAQSVPSFYSAVISTAALAAQIFFAETSGVDVATEVYRVSDGRCIMSRRDRSQQKYVVQAEKTVRRLADGMAVGVLDAMREKEPETMDPLIDDLEPLSILARLK